MSERHTPEPWALRPAAIFEGTIHSHPIIVRADSGWRVTGIEPAGYTSANGETGLRDIVNANARRIVACVNACAGIPTESLECQTKKQLTDKLIEQNRMLAAELEALADRIENRYVEWKNPAARALIARAKEGL